MRQTITVTRSGSLDDWGHPKPSETFTYKCRIDEGTQLIVGHSNNMVTEETVVAEARILLDGLVDIQPSDEITFTNELGQTVTRTPKKIDVKRGLSGKAMFTEVIL